MTTNVTLYPDPLGHCGLRYLADAAEASANPASRIYVEAGLKWVAFAIVAITRRVESIQIEGDDVGVLTHI